MATITKIENSQVEIALEASSEEFEEAIRQAYEKNKRRFQIPGFRKGKVPFQLVCQYYGKQVFYEDAIEAIAQKGYETVLKENDLKIVSRPSLEVDDIGETGLKYRLVVTVKPDVTLGAYEGVEATYFEREITDESVDAEIERTRKRNSSIENVEGRPAQKDDTVVIDFEGFKDGIAFEGGKGENYSLKIGSNSFIPGFEDQIIGHSIDEEFEVKVTFPEEYHSEELKGQDAVFNVKIHNIKEEKLPELDDDFVKDVSEFDTLDEYKADIRKTQQEQASNEAKNQFMNEVVSVVASNATVEIPEVMIDNEATNMAEEQASRMEQQGIPFDTYLQYLGQTKEQFKEGLKGYAETRVRSNLVIEAVASALNMEATDEEYNDEIAKMAESYKMSVEDLTKALGESNEFIKNNIVNRKTVEYLASKAVKVAPKDEEADSSKTEEKPKKAKKTTKAKKEESSSEE